MTGLDQVREIMADYLRAQGVDAVTAWPETPRRHRSAPVAAVSLRGCSAQAAGFQDYLGERYNEQKKCWEELYGKRMKLTLGLDLYGTKGGAELARAADDLAEALHKGGPAALRVEEFSMGEAKYETEMGLYRCPAEAVCEAYLYAAAEAGGSFLDFEIRGESK